MNKKVENLIEQIEQLSIIELSELINCIKTHFNLPDIQAASAVSNTQEAQEEQTSFKVVLKEVGSNRVNIIKAFIQLISSDSSIIDSCSICSIKFSTFLFMRYILCSIGICFSSV
jgi:hypothetical protein